MDGRQQRELDHIKQPRREPNPAGGANHSIESGASSPVGKVVEKLHTALKIFPAEASWASGVEGCGSAVSPARQQRLRRRLWVRCFKYRTDDSASSGTRLCHLRQIR